MVRKNAAFEEKGAALGHNKPNDKAKMEYTQGFIDLDIKIEKLKDEKKELLNRAKDEGHLKTAIRKAAKTLQSSEATVQAKKEVEHEHRYIVQLFANKHGQYSFLRDNEAA